VVSEDDHQVLNLKANQLWHTDSTFLPVPALANILAARVVPSTGGETEFVSTRAAWHDMPEALRARIRGKAIHHRYAHSRAKISGDLAKDDLFTMWQDQTWQAVWRNPVNGEEALYIASHAYAVDGMDEEEGRDLIDELVAWSTQERYVYSHRWQVGDVLIWDERATLHRGRPWPYGEPRTLASICVSVSDADGFASMRPAA
jgi:alpha-ketoglutarate-dependent 2,4-dichlorophenoxyacetate dioxygenase